MREKVFSVLQSGIKSKGANIAYLNSVVSIGWETKKTGNPLSGTVHELTKYSKSLDLDNSNRFWTICTGKIIDLSLIHI